MRSINDYIPTLIHVILLVFILIRLHRTSIGGGRVLRPQLVFFTISMAVYLLIDFYWLAFDILYPEDRMPFAANEIGECALFLSLASSIKASAASMSGMTEQGDDEQNTGAPALWERLGVLLFTAANAGLWIAWSGEWVQDIVTCIVWGYFLFHLTGHMKKTKALSPTVWRILAPVCVLVIAANIATFFVPENFKSMSDLAAYSLMLAVDLFFIIKTVLCLYSKKDLKVPVSLSFACYGWSIFFLYMSSGFYYNLANLLCSSSCLLMYVSIRREAVS